MAIKLRQPIIYFKQLPSIDIYQFIYINQYIIYLQWLLINAILRLNNVNLCY
jgi:hypothetical protein